MLQMYVSSFSSIFSSSLFLLPFLTLRQAHVFVEREAEAKVWLAAMGSWTGVETQFLMEPRRQWKRVKPATYHSKKTFFTSTHDAFHPAFLKEKKNTFLHSNQKSALNSTKGKFSKHSDAPSAPGLRYSLRSLAGRKQKLEGQNSRVLLSYKKFKISLDYMRSSLR